MKYKEWCKGCCNCLRLPENKLYCAVKNMYFYCDDKVKIDGCVKTDFDIYTLYVKMGYSIKQAMEVSKIVLVNKEIKDE